MRRLNWWKTACAVCALCATTEMVLPAQTFTTLHSFDYADGANPESALVQATDGNLYGTTSVGGANGSGTVFRITPTGTLTTVYNFCSQLGCTDGATPQAGLIQTVDGNLYGTTSAGGANGDGTVFQLTLDGTLTTLHSFCSESDCTDGNDPRSALVEATDGNFYGTTYSGTAFKITPSGTLTTLASFSGIDGSNSTSALVQATGGNLYGTAPYGGTNDWGTIFRITLGGTRETLYRFHGGPPENHRHPEAAYPIGGLVQATDGNFYGTTYQGRDDNEPACEVPPEGCGTVFSITPSGKLSVVFGFDRGDGANPEATPIQATDGNLYGTTAAGGNYDVGTVFSFTPSDGTLRSLVSFSFDWESGDVPVAALVQGTDGTFYGTTYYGGGGDACTHRCGTVFSLSVGLGPFVETQPAFGNTGAAVNILGNNLRGATAVTFNGTTATFTAESNSLITTTVPAGATTGTVQVVTPGGTLSSNVPFRVVP